ncbi:MAG TPA: hypothetical protein VJZ17_02665 [Nitrosopumilaceae archaeon]|nr:hypothetical protein [Nitrosopumilaceae archaeon]
MKDPHNFRAVGWSMVVVAGSLAIIGLLVLAIGQDPYFSDKILKQKQAEFKEMNEMELKMKNQSVELDEKLRINAVQSGMFILASYLE